MKKRGVGLICMIAAAVVLCIVCGIVCFALVKQSYIADKIMEIAKPAIEKALNADLEYSPLKGNLISGMSLSDVIIKRNEKKLAAADEIVFNISFASLLRLSPKISITVDGLKTDVDSVNSLIPKTEQPADKPANIPIDVVKIKNSGIDTQWGTVLVNNSSVEIANSWDYTVALNGKITDIVDFAIKGRAHKKDGNWIADRLTVSVDDGNVTVNGAVFPNPNLTLKADKFNLSKPAALFPQVRSLGIRGILTADAKLSGTGKNLKTSGEAVLDHALIRGIPIESFAAKFDYADGVLKTDIGKSNVMDSEIAGRLMFDTNKKYIDMDMGAKNLKLKEISDEFSKELGGTKTILHGTVTELEAKLNGTLDSLVGTVAISPSDIGYDSFELKGLRGSVDFRGGKTGKVDFSAAHSGKPISVKGVLSLAEKTPTDVKISCGGFELSEFSDLVPQLKKNGVSGHVSLDAKITGLLNKWVLSVNTRAKDIKTAKFGTVSELAADGSYSMANGSAELKSFNAVWNGAKVTAHGKYSTGKTDGIDFSGTLENGVTEDFFEILKFLKNANIKTVVSGKWNISGNPKNPHVTASIDTRGGTILYGLPIDTFSTSLDYKEGVLNVDPMTAMAKKGRLHAKCRWNKADKKWSLNGNFRDISLNMIFKGVTGMDDKIYGRLDGDFALGNESGAFGWKANITESRLFLRGFRIESAVAELSGDAKTINIKKASVGAFRGMCSANGTAVIGKKPEDWKFDINVAADKLNIFEITRRHAPTVKGFTGLIAGSGKITGSAADPQFTASAHIAPLKINGMLCPMLNVRANGNLQRIKADADIAVRGELIANAEISKQADNWYAKVDVDGKDLELKQFAMYMPTKYSEGLGGSVSFKLNGTGTPDNFAADGEISSRFMKLFGLELSDFKAPFYFIDSNYCIIEDLKANTNGGTIEGGAAYDIKAGRWGANCSVSKVNIATAMKQVLPDVEGSVGGTGEMKIKIGGGTSTEDPITALGGIYGYNGELSGFKAVEAAKKYTKGKPIRFEKIQMSFKLDDGMLIIYPGTGAVAPKGDTVYRAVMIDGMVTTNGDLALAVMGKVNIRALNSILGGFSGVMDTGKQYVDQGSVDTKDAVQNILGGLIGGAARNSFRFFTMNIGGSINSPKFKDIKVDSDPMRNVSGNGNLPKSNSDPDDRKTKNDEDMVFKLNFTFPVGYGATGEASDLGGHFLQQTFQNILQGVNY